MSDEPEAHEGQVVVGDISTVDGSAKTGVPTVRFVHYPGAQQLILWLPQSGYHGYGELALARGADVIERATVRSRLNGSIQILWNTLPWPPGDYVISIPHEEGWRHEVRLTKLAPDVPLPEPEPPPVAEPSQEPIVYRDGLGNVIPNVDLEIRERVHRQVAQAFARRLEFEGTARAGKIVYLDGVHRIEFYNELCGGGMKVSIAIPTAEEWEAATGAPLSLREEIVAFVAKRTQQEQASNWRYEITDSSIDFF